jgi:DNA-binding response OmpR family regulator
MKSILLVDDEAKICGEFQRTLQELGYLVEVASTVESALGSINGAQFDAILVEFNLTSDSGALPRTGGGIRLIRDLRKSGTTIPIVVYTVMEGETYKAASLDAGADDFILKQIPISDFFSRLREHIMMRGGTLGQ